MTVDFDTIETGVVTIRHRDTMLQQKINLTDLEGFVFKNIY
ncbi:MAG: His/Gly/Thr/Pro-type tRNA ligase C-terminal domain-containing protein [Mycoplasma sp.]